MARHESGSLSKDGSGGGSTRTEKSGGLSHGGEKEWANSSVHNTEGGNPIIGQVVAFTGVDTGRKYNVGETYRMNGNEYRANADGSFTNLSTGRVLEGSALSPEARFTIAWGGAAGVGGAKTGGGATGGAATGRLTLGDNSHVTTGPGSSGAASGGKGTAPGAGRAQSILRVQQASQSAVPWRTQETSPDFSYRGHDGFIPMGSPAEIEGRQFPMGNLPLELSPYFPSGQTIEDELGDTDFLSPGWFAAWGSAIGSAVWNVDRARDHVGRHYVKAPIDAAIDAVNTHTPGDDVWDGYAGMGQYSPMAGSRGW